MGRQGKVHKVGEGWGKGVGEELGKWEQGNKPKQSKPTINNNKVRHGCKVGGCNETINNNNNKWDKYKSQ